MSELKTFDSQRIYWAVEQVERVAGDIDELHLDDNLFYLKSEADEKIAMSKKKLVEQTTLRVWAELQLRHNKYKRCLNMAKWCKYWANYWKCCEPPDCSLFIAKAKYYRKWQKRWLKIAEQFKENG